jgi:hypothetical protein
MAVSLSIIQRAQCGTVMLTSHRGQQEAAAANSLPEYDPKVCPELEWFCYEPRR